MSCAHLSGATRLPPDLLMSKLKSYTVVPHRDPTLVTKVLKEAEHVELQYSSRNVLLKGTSFLMSVAWMNRGLHVTSVDNAALHAAGTSEGKAAGFG
jgi:hypothetical protein